MKKWYRRVSVMFVGIALIGSAMLVQPALAQLRDNEPGSFLVYPLFDIHSGNQTKIRVTNNGVLGKWVRVIAVCPGSTVLNGGVFDPTCPESNRRDFLTSHATRVYDVATEFFPPCLEGYAVIFAQSDPDAVTGISTPIAYNSLIGDFQIIYGPQSAPGDTTTEAANAIAIQSNSAPGTLLGFDDGGFLGLSFGTPAASQSTADYVALPLTLVGDFAAIGGLLSPAATGIETDTRLILLTLQTVTGATNPVSRAAIVSWNLGEQGPFSTSREFVCWDRFDVSDPQSTIFKKSPAGPLLGDYGSLRVTTTTNGPAYLGAIEEVSSLGAGASRGNTIRDLFHAGMKSAIFNTDRQ